MWQPPEAAPGQQLPWRQLLQSYNCVELNSNNNQVSLETDFFPELPERNTALLML